MFQFLRDHTHFNEWIWICSPSHNFVPTVGHISLSWFSCGPSVLTELELKVLVSLWRDKNWRTQRKTLGARMNNKTQPTCGTGNWTQATLVGWAFLPLRQHCSPVDKDTPSQPLPHPLRLSKPHVQWLKPAKHHHKWLYRLPFFLPTASPVCFTNQEFLLVLSLFLTHLASILKLNHFTRLVHRETTYSQAKWRIKTLPEIVRHWSVMGTIFFQSFNNLTLFFSFF